MSERGRESGQRGYWNEHIASWDASAYGQDEALPLIERIATPFRGHLGERRNFGVAFLELTRPRSVLELGCGTGELLAQVPPDLALERYVGVDISEVAIEKARARSLSLAGGGAPEFMVSSMADLDVDALGDFDVVLGMGLTPYLLPDELDKFLAIIARGGFLFDYHCKGPTLQNTMHWVYRKVVKFPSYRLFDDAEIASLLRGAGIEGFEIVKHRGQSFAQRRPASTEATAAG